ncbi:MULTISPECIES: carboxymuconolactone decarboxylase family protein [unclassified Sphingomonas]|uniref:carboxymuconolactone decarboxylase family protein n=1 Tax=unclassified Sphingomonas TaxID=196159 RepID=UPI0006FE8C57|nr:MULTISPECIES: carboxymuconolactone decarboxylase family protein [unclassified Sphingomonas]KQX22838.1 alkylhydroperoxidase [Sphingomonas sp. Root1294]KQY67964.1 alkylhydroperoxidase [Sphingomonas sp. Root50]KRB88882.1 alkylhydroperoxidase [Sphingomonas sp. Root720]
MTNATSAPRYEQETPDIIKAFTEVQAVINGQELEPLLRHLVMLRASQINGCGHCVQMHTREARADGETNERLDHLVIWEQARVYGEREKAALAWTEALTTLDHHADLGALRARLREHFSEKELAALSALIATINMWNRIGISRH